MNKNLADFTSLKSTLNTYQW